MGPARGGCSQSVRGGWRERPREELHAPERASPGPLPAPRSLWKGLRPPPPAPRRPHTVRGWLEGGAGVRVGVCTGEWMMAGAPRVFQVFMLRLPSQGDIR